MSVTTPSSLSRKRSRPVRSHLLPIVAGAVIVTIAAGAIVWLLRPPFNADPSGDPQRLPVNIGGTLFNVPTLAVRVKLQRRSGPQERIDLAFDYPSLEAPTTPRHVSADTVENGPLPIDRLFVSIAAHRDVLAPEERVRTIYARYVEPTVPRISDGLAARAFRDGTPYAQEDLFTSDTPRMAARCTRDGTTPAMCLSERRIGGADLTFRFPRAWLAQWRDLQAAMDRVATRLQQHS